VPPDLLADLARHFGTVAGTAADGGILIFEDEFTQEFVAKNQPFLGTFYYGRDDTAFAVPLGQFVPSVGQTNSPANVLGNLLGPVLARSRPHFLEQAQAQVRVIIPELRLGA